MSKKKKKKKFFAHLSHHDGEGENANKVVDELENNFKEGGGVRQPADGDQALHRKVVTADVAEERSNGKNRTQHGIAESSVGACPPHSPVAFTVVHPLGRSQSVKGRAPVV